MAEYTPTTDEVRINTVADMPSDHPLYHERLAQFDRWLVKHDQQVAEQVKVKDIPAVCPAQVSELPVADCGHVPTLDPDGRTVSCHPCGRMWPISYLPNTVQVTTEQIDAALDAVEALAAIVTKIEELPADAFNINEDGGDGMRHTPSEALVALSQWIDAGNTHRDPEAVTWGYLAKISEECGEVIDAFMGATGFNPRKGVVGSVEVEVVEESLDVAVTALIVIEHITGLHGYALGLLNEKIMRTANRAGVLS